MQIETERLLIKSLELVDVEALAGLWTDPEVTRFMGGPRDYESLKKGYYARGIVRQSNDPG